MHRILLLIPATSYRATAFIEAARSINVEVTVGSDHRSTLAEMNPAGLLTIDIYDIARAVEAASTFTQLHSIDAVIGVDDQSVVAASAIAEELGLPHNTIISVSAARNKYIMREFLTQHNVPQPSYKRISIDENYEYLPGNLSFPAVLKPVALSGSRGVIKVNDKYELQNAFHRVRKILDTINRKELTHDSRYVLIEEYIEGDEIAVEGLITDDDCNVLAIFDKPDRLTGPYFEETIYTTPSRHNPDTLADIIELFKQAVFAIGLSRGPVHAEIRFNDSGVYIIEVAARSIGGYCSQTLRFQDATRPDRIISLEELIIRNALNNSIDSIHRESDASGVMMIPAPRRGTLHGVRGIEAAKKIAGITELIISSHIGQELVPLPEGGKYPGFIFARAKVPSRVEQLLRKAYEVLEFDVR